MNPPNSPQPLPPSPLETAWEEVDRHWDDPEAHRRYLATASALGSLDVAGGRYRAERDANPSRRATAEAQIQALLGLALASLSAAKEAPLPGARRWVNLLAAALILALFTVAGWALLRLFRAGA